MSIHPIPNPPPGFEELSKEEQIEYLQELWNQISADESKVSVPQWHRDILRARMATTDDEATETWEEVKTRLEGRSRE
jgi:putative addiction module component (TIGR02574 family)